MVYARPATRPLRATVVLAVGVGLILAGCRSSPTVAAYVGGSSITEAQVDGVLANARAALGAEPGTQPPGRSAVVTTLVLDKVCHAEQAKRGFSPNPIGVEQIKQLEKVPADSDYARARSSVYSCLAGVPIPDTGTQPSDAELRDIYDRAKAKGLVRVPFEQIREQLAADPGVQQALAVNRELTSLVQHGDVTVNPRYRPMEFPISDLGSGQTLIVLPVGEPPSDAVHDAS
jgi:hypothetical protein